jgi:hypothetical protein
LTRPFGSSRTRPNRPNRPNRPTGEIQKERAKISNLEIDRFAEKFKKIEYKHLPHMELRHRRPLGSRAVQAVSSADGRPTGDHLRT